MSPNSSVWRGRPRPREAKHRMKWLRIRTSLQRCRESTPSIAPLGADRIVNEALARELAARRGAGGIVFGEFAGTDGHAVSRLRGFNRETYKRQKAGSGPRPLGGGSPAAAMVLTTAIGRPKRGFGRFAVVRLRHRVMARHRGALRCGLSRRRFSGDSSSRDGLSRDRPAHAMHGLRRRSAGQRQRPERRNEHHQQQKSGSAAVSSPHCRKAYQKPSSQFPVLGGH